VSIRNFLFRLYWKLENLIVPTLKYSQYHYYAHLQRIVPSACSWLDMGCGHQMFAAWMLSEQQELSSRARRLIGVDLDWEGLRKHRTIDQKVFAHLQRLPFASESFDVITANMVVEHLSTPDEVLREAYRILRPGGLFIFHTPNIRSLAVAIASKLPQHVKNLLALVLENRNTEDVFPTFYRMNTEGAIQEKAAHAGFELRDLKAVSSSAVTAMLGPLVVIELLYLRMLEVERFRGLRSNLIGTLQKPGHASIWEAQ
jgi:ubiquinone/menaquinone biosynthesis C-methylase UbiE